jgi:hypothetical protein
MLTCVLCGASFKTAKLLDLHISIHHNKDTYNTFVKLFETPSDDKDRENITID